MLSRKSKAVTIVELTVVILILSILASIAATVYAGYMTRARFAVARSDIHQLELAATRYQVDLGAYPISSTGTAFGGTTAPNPRVHPTFFTSYGNGYLVLLLLHSWSGTSDGPASERWFGPYIDIPAKQLGTVSGDPVTDRLSAAEVNMLDPWGSPYFYTRKDEYDTHGATENRDSPFLTAFYNPDSVQIFSLGPDADTRTAPYAGTAEDDISNF